MNAGNYHLRSGDWRPTPEHAERQRLDFLAAIENDNLSDAAVRVANIETARSELESITDKPFPLWSRIAFWCAIVVMIALTVWSAS